MTPLLDGSHELPGNYDPRNMDLLVAFPSNARHKLNRVLVTLQPRLATAKTDVEDLIARSDQEVTARQFLMIKVGQRGNEPATGFCSITDLTRTAPANTLRPVANRLNPTR
ncbi:hypothetical protein L6164_013244 [Bauhinia variegata]|uniref:Uncharacterized protein n=1 Tax=Bauhinia variegata TaxID=167791 RepID=A0ACB9PFA4_BAUVA|nr:hypothetical protein L6164_013244 [Bauhinia variegata]